MTAHEVLPPGLDNADEWKALRRKGIGGSDVSAVLGVSDYRSRFDLWLEKTGRAPEVEPTAAMRWGHLLEPVVRQAFTEDTGIDVDLVGTMVDDDRPWMRVNVDGLTDDGGVFEAKTLSGWVSRDWGDGQVADHAEAQVQWGMEVLDLPHAWVACLIDGRDFRIRRVERDREFGAFIVDEAEKFWHDHVEGDVEPALVASDLESVRRLFPSSIPDRLVDTDDPSTVRQLLDALAGAKAEMKSAEAERDRLEAELTYRIGDAEGLVAAGYLVATRKTYERTGIDAKALRAEQPDVAATYTTKTPYRRLSIPKKPKQIGE